MKNNLQDKIGPAAQSPNRSMYMMGFALLLVSCTAGKPRSHHHAAHVHTSPPTVATIHDTEAPTVPPDIDSFLATGWMLMKQGQFDESITCVQEGLTNNPDSFQLHYLMGQIHLNKAKQQTVGALSLDQVHTAPMLKAACAAYAKATTLGFSARQAAESEESTWTTYLETDLRATSRMDAMMEHRFGNPEIAIRKAQRALAILKTDTVLERNLAKWQAP